VTRSEMGSVLAYLSASVGKPIAPETGEVYHDLLGDLPLPVLQAAARRAVLESSYPVLPPVGVLRRLAVEALEGSNALCDCQEAVCRVKAAVSRFGFNGAEKARPALPEHVWRAVENFGWRRLCDSTDGAIVWAQFRDCYESMAGRERRERLLPEPLRRTLRALAGEAGPGLKLLTGESA
jgi:hypothetical protein